MAAICAWLAAVAHGAPSGLFVSPAILPKVGYAAPDVTVVRQPYVVHHTEPVVYRQPAAAVYYADPLATYHPSYHVTYHQQPPAAAVYQAAPYAHTVVNYVA